MKLSIKKNDFRKEKDLIAVVKYSDVTDTSVMEKLFFFLLTFGILQSSGDLRPTSEMGLTGSYHLDVLFRGKEGQGKPGQV